MGKSSKAKQIAEEKEHEHYIREAVEGWKQEVYGYDKKTGRSIQVGERTVKDPSLKVARLKALRPELYKEGVNMNFNDNRWQQKNNLIPIKIEFKNNADAEKFSKACEVITQKHETNQKLNDSELDLIEQSWMRCHNQPVRPIPKHSQHHVQNICKIAL